MGTSPFSDAVQAVRRPLAFAQEAPASAARIRDLEQTVAGAAARACKLAIPTDAKALLSRVERAFTNPLESAARAQAVEKSLGWLAVLADPDWAEQALARSPATLPGVGPKRADLLARRGIRRVDDLLMLFPGRYDDRRRLKSVGELEVGTRATFVAQVLACDVVPIRGGRRFKGWARQGFQALVGDETGTVMLKWFRGADSIQRSIGKDVRLLVSGEIRRYRFSKELVHPEIERLGEAESLPTQGRRIVPVYPAIERMPARSLRHLIEAAVASYADLVPGFLPPQHVRARGLPDVPSALRSLHAPQPAEDEDDFEEETRRARERLVLEELFLLETGLALRRLARGREPGIPIDVRHPRVVAAEEALPFVLTGAQRRAWSEIRADLGRPHPMQRLLQGDVGSGKTAVAFLAALAVSASARQTAFMAPTELLAEQHERTLISLSEGGDEATHLRIARLTASMPRLQADRVRAALAAGAVDLVVGTQALLQKGVRFHGLALAIVDEQHRFGVRQRAALGERSGGDAAPHTLVMTATPIPRSLALTVYGDLDLSVIDELPPGRCPVATHLLRAGEGERVAELIRATVARREQVYVVYPLVEESEKIDLRAATEQAERIGRAFPGVRVALVHGRLDAEERAQVMARFVSGATQILVSTTVIEVGVDVPNATLMIVENAERFGLAQLHQLRGRVGRGSRPGVCLLVARRSGEESEARLLAMLETTDGFRIADADLRIRGPGEFLGTQQSGRLPDLRLADLVRDGRRVAEAREAAFQVVRRDPDLRRTPDLLRAVQARWGERLSLLDVG